MALSEYPGIEFVLGEIFESAGSIKLALKDGKLDVGEVVSAIPDDGVREYIGKLLVALNRLPDEVEQVTKAGPWGMMGLFQEVAIKAMAIFK